jgi:PAS domain S-box-containing protein
MGVYVDLPDSDIERLVPKGAVLVSKSDLDGNIIYCNKAFCEISGYSEGELLGASHNVVRHPDMPRELFADCWQSIKSGKPWNAVIKNRCKDGGYYWVEANITPWIERGEKTGYVSLRYQATPAQIAAAQATYRAVRDGFALGGHSSAHDLRYIVELQQRLADKIMALEIYHDRSEEELQTGSEIMSRIYGMSSTFDACVRQKISPAAHYSGDMILSTRTPVDVLHLLLADAVGHGLTAAINVLPLSQTFYRMSKKGFSLARIAEELNQKINKFMPVDRFVSATLISVDLRNQVVEVWNGGNPAPVLVTAEGVILKTWPSRHLPLGIFARENFSAETTAFHYDQNCQLFLYSDGLPEAESPSGVAFGDERIDMLLQQSLPAQRFDALVSALEGHLSGTLAHDDVSLAMVDIAVLHDQSDTGDVSALPDERYEAEDGWRVSLSLGASELKSVAVVPLIMQMVAKVHAVCNHHSELFLIISELFNNALDHGLLCLDSRMKQGADGFEAYLELREERLRKLHSGKIDVDVSRVVIEGRYGVKVRVIDSGDGFDCPVFQSDDFNQQTQYGRGLALVKGLVYRLEFAQHGKEVIAYYACATCKSANAVAR